MKDLTMGADMSCRGDRGANFPPALNDGNLAADNPERAKVAAVEYSRARITGGGDVGDRGVGPASQIGQDRLARENPGAGRPFGNGHDDRFAGIRRPLTDRHATHP